MESEVMTIFDERLEKATDTTKTEPDRDAIVEICSLISEGIIDAKKAVSAISRKLVNKDLQVVLFALEVLKAIFNCGNYVKKIVCTIDYMNSLITVINTAKDDNVRNEISKIVEKWVRELEYFPLYVDAPKKFLDVLKAEPNSGPLSLLIKDNSDNKNCIDKKSATDSNIRQEKPGNSGLQELRKIQEERYKKYRKSQGLPPLSDEEDDQKEERLSNAFRESDWKNKEQTAQSATKKLPKELELIRQQRKYNQEQINDHRLYLRQNSVENGQRHCTDRNCENCSKYVNKVPDPAIEIPKRLPPELRKVKESKALLQDSSKEIREMKRNSYYQKLRQSPGNRQNAPQNMNPNHQILGGIPPAFSNDEYFIDDEEEQEEEDDELIQAIAHSLMDAGDGVSHEDDLQQAIDLSMADLENKDFSSLPKMEGGDQLMALGLQISLEETSGSSRRLVKTRSEDDNECVACLEDKPLLYCIPCNHKCFCDDCKNKYNSNLCPICRRKYTSISTIPLGNTWRR